MYRFGKSSPTTPTIFTGLKKLAATAAWLAEPPSRRGFSAFGVLMESRAVEPTMSTLMGISNGRNSIYVLPFQTGRTVGNWRGTGKSAAHVRSRTVWWGEALDEPARADA